MVEELVAVLVFVPVLELVQEVFKTDVGAFEARDRVLEE